MKGRRIARHRTPEAAIRRLYFFSREVRAFLEREYDLHHKFLHFPGNGLINFLLKFDRLISYTLLVCA